MTTTDYEAELRAQMDAGARTGLAAYAGADFGIMWTWLSRQAGRAADDRLRAVIDGELADFEAAQGWRGRTLAELTYIGVVLHDLDRLDGGSGDGRGARLASRLLRAVSNEAWAIGNVGSPRYMDDDSIRRRQGGNKGSPPWVTS